MTPLILLLTLALADEPKGQLAAPEGPASDVAAQAVVPTDGVADLPLLGSPPLIVPPPATVPFPPPDPLRTIAGFVLEHGLAVAAILAVAFGSLGGYVAMRRGLPTAEGLVVGALFWPLGVLVVLLLPAASTGRGVSPSA